MDDDPEYYISLSKKLENIIEKYEQKWDEMLASLLDLVENIENIEKDHAASLGLSEDERAFFKF